MYVFMYISAAFVIIALHIEAGGQGEMQTEFKQVGRNCRISHPYCPPTKVLVRPEAFLGIRDLLLLVEMSKPFAFEELSYFLQVRFYICRGLDSIAAIMPCPYSGCWGHNDR
jgi:hypothetical protein